MHQTPAAPMNQKSMQQRNAPSPPNTHATLSNRNTPPSSQIIAPKIVASNLGIPPIVSIMGMYIGLQLFGFIGIFIMPIVITVLKVLNDDGVIHIWRSSKKSVAADAAAVQPEDVSAEEENQETDGEPKE